MAKEPYFLRLAKGWTPMRMMLKIQMPVEEANKAIADGRLGKVISSTLDRLKPEAAYFSTIDGDRGGFFVFDLQNPNDIPSICEPFFFELHAKVELSPAMTPEDVKTGLAKAAAFSLVRASAHSG